MEPGDIVLNPVIFAEIVRDIEWDLILELWVTSTEIREMLKREVRNIIRPSLYRRVIPGDIALSNTRSILFQLKNLERVFPTIHIYDENVESKVYDELLPQLKVARIESELETIPSFIEDSDITHIRNFIGGKRIFIQWEVWMNGEAPVGKEELQIVDMGVRLMNPYTNIKTFIRRFPDNADVFFQQNFNEQVVIPNSRSVYYELVPPEEEPEQEPGFLNPPVILGSNLQTISPNVEEINTILPKLYKDNNSAIDETHMIVSAFKDISQFSQLFPNLKRLAGFSHSRSNLNRLNRHPKLKEVYIDLSGFDNIRVESVISNLENRRFSFQLFIILNDEDIDTFTSRHRTISVSALREEWRDKWKRDIKPLLDPIFPTL